MAGTLPIVKVQAPGAGGEDNEADVMLWSDQAGQARNEDSPDARYREAEAESHLGNYYSNQGNYCEALKHDQAALNAYDRIPEGDPHRQEYDQQFGVTTEKKFLQDSKDKTDDGSKCEPALVS